MARDLLHESIDHESNGHDVSLGGSIVIGTNDSFMVVIQYEQML